MLRGLTLAIVACALCASLSVASPEELSATQQDLPPGLAPDESTLKTTKESLVNSLGEDSSFPGPDEDSNSMESKVASTESRDAISVLKEGKRQEVEMRQRQEQKGNDLGEGQKDKDKEGVFSSNIYITDKGAKLRVGEAWGMPGLYSSDDGPRDLVLGVGAGKKVYFGTAKNDAWIESTTGHMWLKGSMTVNNYGHFFADDQRLRVGAAWGMPGIYASDGANRDMIIGTAAGKKIFFGVKQDDAWIEAGSGDMWLKGSITVKEYAHFFAENQRLRVGAVWGMPGLYASDGKNRDMIIGTAAGKKIYFGVKKDDASIEAGTGDMFLKGRLTVKSNSLFTVGDSTLRVGSVYGMPGLYAGDGGKQDLILGTESGRRVYFGVKTDDAWIQGGTGDMFLKGSLTSESNANIMSAGQRLIIGTVDGMPGLFASEGEARDLMLGTAAGRKIFFGNSKDNAWIRSGTGDAFFSGEITTSKSIIVKAGGQTLRVGEFSGMPGIYSSDETPTDLIIGSAAGKKVHFGATVADAYITAGEGSMYLKGSLEAHDNLIVYAEGQRLRVGAVDGIPGIFSSDGGARDLMLGAAQNSKVYIGTSRTDAWVQGGTGNSYFKGKMTVGESISVQDKGSILQLGDIDGMPGVYSSQGVGRDLMIGAAVGMKVYLGFGRTDAWVAAGTGAAYFKGAVTAGGVTSAGTMAVKGAAVFEDVVTIKKNLFLQNEGTTMDMLSEMTALRTENAELRAFMMEMKAQMSDLQARR